jgi:raffinose/stachyose/melibiose transport system permease protein
VAERLKEADRKVLGAMVVPGIAVFCFALLIPIAIAVYYSLFTWRSITKPVWNNFANYRELVSDPIFWKALINNLKLAFYTLAGQIGIGYFLAFPWFPGGRVFRNSIVLLCISRR